MAHVTLDLSKYDALTAYKGLPDEKEENPARYRTPEALSLPDERMGSSTPTVT